MNEKTPTEGDLKKRLIGLDGRGYKAYKEIKGSYRFPDFSLLIDHVQGDPFAEPSRLRVQIPQAVAGFPNDLYRNRIRRVALCDYLTRQFDLQARKLSKRRGTGNSGIISIDRPGQEVLERTSAFVDENRLELRFGVGLPADGRKILGKQAVQILCDDIPKIVDRSLKRVNLKRAELEHHVETIEDAEWLRSQLNERGLVAFVAEGAILPRSSGVDPRPLESGTVPFLSPASLRMEFDRPNLGRISGMGIPRGVTLIVGGGYHGKSTLLNAMEYGVYNHIPGDGREFVLTDPAAVKIRAEDGRRVAGVDISPFINDLPQNRSTLSFWTENASGSTSQAANILEAMEAGARMLLIDEDTAATNFMIRDHRMQKLIAKKNEPITPFIDKVRQLFTDHGISTLLVIGGSGDYFDTADRVIAMENFIPKDVTEEARSIARKYTAERKPEGGAHFGRLRHRTPLPESLDPSRGRQAVRLKTPDRKTIVFGTQEIDLSAVEQIVDSSQVRAMAHALVFSKRHSMDGHRTLSEILDHMMKTIEEKGLDALTEMPLGNLARFRRFELAAALNRLRTLEVR